MSSWIPIVILALALLGAILLLLAGRTLSVSRSVVLRLPCQRAWEAIRDFPALHAAHRRGRPRLVIETVIPRDGRGTGVGSVWRQKGSWLGEGYWADLEVVAWDPPRRVAVRLLRDSLSTHKGLVTHRAEITLLPEGPEVTRLVWRLSARIGSARLLASRLLRPDHLRVRLLDVGLRSLKRAIDGAAREEGRAGAPVVEVATSLPLRREAPSEAPRPRGPEARTTDRKRDRT